METERKKRAKEILVYCLKTVKSSALSNTTTEEGAINLKEAAINCKEDATNLEEGATNLEEGAATAKDVIKRSRK